LCDNLTGLIWDVILIHKVSLQAFVSATLVGMYDIFPHKEALFISVHNVSKELRMACICVLISE